MLKVPILLKKVYGMENGLWTFNGESKKRIGHPAPFPIELIIGVLSILVIDDIIFDHFCGSGLLNSSK